jgi:hypothetical protein
LIRKQWLVLYPFALSVVGTLAFFAVYSAGGEPLTWSAFFNANFDRWLFVRDHFITGFSFSEALVVPILAGLAFCVFCAMLQAPFYRAIAGARYPLTPRTWLEATRLFVFYLLLYLVTWMAPLPGPDDGWLAILIFTVLQVVAILVIFVDYVIVFEGRGIIAAVRRGLKLLSLRFGAVLGVYLVLYLVLFGVRSLYGLYYDDATQVFALLPVSQMLVESFVLLLANLVLIFLYEELRRVSPA